MTLGSKYYTQWPQRPIFSSSGIDIRPLQFLEVIKWLKSY